MTQSPDTRLHGARAAGAESRKTYSHTDRQSVVLLHHIISCTWVMQAVENSYFFPDSGVINEALNGIEIFF